MIITHLGRSKTDGVTRIVTRKIELTESPIDTDLLHVDFSVYKDNKLLYDMETIPVSLLQTLIDGVVDEYTKKD